METLRYSFEIFTNQFINEQVQENFVATTTPSPNDYKTAAFFLAPYSITPEEAFKVLIDFDKEPKDLTQDDLNVRIRGLAALDQALNNKDLLVMLKSAFQYNPVFVNNFDAGIALMRRLIGLLVMESISACSTDNCFNILTGKNSTKRTSISDKFEQIIQTNNQTIKSINTDLNEKTEKNKEFDGIIQLDKQTIKSLNTMLSDKNSEIEKKQNENVELSKMYKSVFAERDEMAEKNRILVENSKKLVTIPNILIVVLACIIAYLFATKK